MCGCIRTVTQDWSYRFRFGDSTGNGFSGLLQPLFAGDKVVGDKSLGLAPILGPKGNHELAPPYDGLQFIGDDPTEIVGRTALGEVGHGLFHTVTDVTDAR